MYILKVGVYFVNVERLITAEKLGDRKARLTVDSGFIFDVEGEDVPAFFRQMDGLAAEPEPKAVASIVGRRAAKS